MLKKKLETMDNRLRMGNHKQVSLFLVLLKNRLKLVYDFTIDIFFWKKITN